MERALVYEDLCKQPPIASFIDQSQCIFPNKLSEGQKKAHNKTHPHPYYMYRCQEREREFSSERGTCLNSVQKRKKERKLGN
jgi:hypothetical protein